MISCKFENGDEASLRHVTVNAIVIKDKKILLGKRGTYKGRKILEYGKWGFLGGFLNRDETCQQAVIREVLEESGWEVNNLKLLRVNDNPKRPFEDRQNVDIIFIASAVKRISTSDKEVTELSWFALDHLPKPETVAFDHYDSLKLYQQFLQGKITIPVLGTL